ncbi:MAG: hypothetical protein Q9221_008910 [Calogaya cf. arnoldii]
MDTRMYNQSDASNVREGNEQLQPSGPYSVTSVIQPENTNTINGIEPAPTQPLGRTELDDTSRASSPTVYALGSHDANERLTRNANFIDSLDESEGAERLDQLGDILDAIDRARDHGSNERSENLGLDAVEPHIDGEDNEETPRDRESGLTGGDRLSVHAREHKGKRIDDTEDPNLLYFVEYTPHRSPIEDPREHERNEYPWRTWSRDPTLVGSLSLQENNGSRQSQETQLSDFRSNDDEYRERQQTNWRIAALNDQNDQYEGITRARHFAQHREQMRRNRERIETQELRESLQAFAGRLEAERESHASPSPSEQREEEEQATAALAYREDVYSGEAIDSSNTPEPSPPLSDDELTQEPEQTARGAIAVPNPSEQLESMFRERRLRHRELELQDEEAEALAIYLEAEEEREELEARARRVEAESDRETELPNYGDAIYTRDSPEPLPAYERAQSPSRATPPPRPSHPTPSQEPTLPQPQPQLQEASQPRTQETPQPFQRQTPTHLQADALRALALVGEDSLRSLPTEVLALLGGVDIIGRGVLRELRDLIGFLQRRREGGRGNEGEGR